MSTIDLSFNRSQFPAFAEPSLEGQAFFDNAGGSYAFQDVIDNLNRFYRQNKMQPYGAHPASRRGGEEMDHSHAELAAYLGVSAEEIHLDPSSSQIIYVLAEAFANRLEVGDEVIVTNQDHEANNGVWRRLVRGVNYCAVCLRYQCCVASREAPKTPRISLISFSVEINGGQNANASPMTRLIIPRSWV